MLCKEENIVSTIFAAYIVSLSHLIGLSSTFSAPHTLVVAGIYPPIT